MTRPPLWALVPILMVLMACSGQEPIPAATLTSAAATAEIKFHNPIADEHHPDAATSEHSRIHRGDRHANTSVLDGSGHVDTDPRADGCCNALCRRTGDYSGDYRRPNPNGYRGVQSVPMEALGRR